MVDNLNSSCLCRYCGGEAAARPMPVFVVALASRFYRVSPGLPLVFHK
jgi:hypothetical protein